MTRRHRVNVLIAINGIGFVLCGTALGGIVKAGVTPWYGLAGAVFMFLGVVVPVYREFVGMRDGFNFIEREAMRSIKHRKGEKKYQEVYDDRPMDSPFKRVANQPVFAMAITFIAWCLMIVEAFLWFTPT
jgi:hypothetical protein